MARELEKVPEESREEVLNEAKKEGKITAKTVRDAAKKTEKTVVDDMGSPVPEGDSSQVLGSKSEIEEVYYQTCVLPSAVARR